MSRLERFGETHDVEITVLVDNQADLIIKSTESVKRFKEKPLLAEHGFAALVDLKYAGVRVLWDAGMTRFSLLENAKRMKVDLSTVDKIALSHGHQDHYAGMTDVIQMIIQMPGPREWDKKATVEELRAYAKRRRVPLVAHPAALRERWWIGKEGKKEGPFMAPSEEWRALGAEIIASDAPYQLGPGCWTTGAVPRRSFEKAGRPAELTYRMDDQFIPDDLDDDQAIAINIKDKGLVVLTGCAHAGVVNTVEYAREMSGVEKVWAVLGGFHLATAKEPDIQRTIDEIQKLEPAMVVPSHCTGFQAMSRFAAEMPEQFVLGVVGTKYLF
jgi:7,8-dihydropterin-6-yl-methyl-4-(beta-D-ribofuranosyl)aminobenzene 5'-phosphate synthase